MKRFLCIILSLTLGLTLLTGITFTASALPGENELPIRSVIIRDHMSETAVENGSWAFAPWDTFKSKVKNNKSTYGGKTFDYNGAEISRQLLDEDCYFPDENMIIFNLPLNKMTMGSLGSRARNAAGVSPSWRELNVSSYLDKAFFVADIWLGGDSSTDGNYAAANVDDLMIITGRANDSFQNDVFGIPLAPYYSQEDVGSIKRIKVPLSAFADAPNLFGIGTASINFARILAFGIGYKLESSDYTAPVIGAMSNVFVYNSDDLKNTMPTPDFSVVPGQNEINIVMNDYIIDAAMFEIYKDGTLVDCVTKGEDFKDTDVQIGNTYSYSVRAIDYNSLTGSPMSASKEVSVTTIGEPVNFAAAPVKYSIAAELTWDDPLFGDCKEYIIYRDGDEIARVDYGVNSYVDDDSLEDYREYTYSIQSVAADGDMSNVTPGVSVVVRLVAYPENVTAAQKDTSVEISWDLIEDAVIYDVYRNGDVIAQTADNTYTDTQCDLNTCYSYQIMAKDALDNKSRLTDPVYVNYLDLSREYKHRIYDDKTLSGFEFEVLDADIEDVIMDNLPCAELTFIYDGADETSSGFECITPLDLSSLRTGTAALEMNVYIPEETYEDTLYATLSYSTKLTKGTFVLRSRVPLEDYVSEKGKWAFVSIPLSDFPGEGLYYASAYGDFYRSEFDFSAIQSISVTSDISKNTNEAKAYIANVAISTGTAPIVSDIRYVSGENEITESEGVLTDSIDGIELTFSDPMDMSSFAGNVRLVSGDAEYDIVGQGEGRVYRIYFAEALGASQSYELDVSSVISKDGYVLSSPIKINFTTSSQQVQTAVLPKQILSMNCASGSDGSAVTAKVSIDEKDVLSAPITSIEYSLNYNPAYLNTTAESVTLSDAISGAQVDADNEGVIKITFDASEPCVLQGDLFSITFNPVISGTSELSISGTQKVAIGDNTYDISADKSSVNIIATVASSNTGSDSTDSDVGGKRPNKSNGSGNSPSVITPPVKTPLKDADSVPWAAQSIKYLYDNGFVSGYSDGTFRPGNNVTRAELVTMVIDAFGIKASETASEFADVNSGDWYYADVVNASSNKIISGYPDGTFGPNEYIARQDMCVIISNILDLKGIEAGDSTSDGVFADNDIMAAYAASSVTKLYNMGIVNGVGDNRFDPCGDVTRAMAAKIIYEVITRY
ncbi:MAG: S-layer homology domain-containing protein [Clostridia bacterium]|nr:S-layer homology domain-containing protein [Clostridia bacterium]